MNMKQSQTPAEQNASPDGGTPQEKQKGHVVALANLSRYRGELMGAAMLFIILFHVNLPRSDMFFGLRRCGNVGVDMFFLLSGIGLWYSWTKRPELWHFFKNRYLRIYPSWLVMASIYYISRWMAGGDKFTGSVTDVVLNILVNWSFWRADDLAFWFVPAIMMLYCFAPAYMQLIKKHPVWRWMPALMMVWCVMVQWVQPIHAAVGHLEIFWSRVPIFFLGINFGEWVKQKREIDGSAVWLLVLTFALTLTTCVYLEQQLHGRFPLFIERMVYIPLTVSSLLLLVYVFKVLPKGVNWFLRLLGGVSLEVYLIHLYLVLAPLHKLSLGYWTTALLTLLISLPLAWLLNRLVKMLAGLAMGGKKEADG